MYAVYSAECVTIRTRLAVLLGKISCLTVAFYFMILNLILFEFILTPILSIYVMALTITGW